MKEGIYNFLKGSFLINEDAINNWRFILFCTLLAIIMIAGSHSSERKVHHLAKLHKEVRELRSEFIDARKRLMEMKMESSVINKLESTGIAPSEEPPIELRVNKNN